MEVFIFTVNNMRHMVQNYLIIGLVLALMIKYIQFLWKRRYLYIHSWKVEGPLSFPIIGCGYLFVGNGTAIIQRLIKIQQNTTRGIARMWLGPKLMYLIFKPEHIETVLNHPNALEKDGIYKFIGESFGYGLLTAPVKKWKHHRRVLAPAFNQRVLDSFVEVFAEKSLTLIDKLKKVVGQKDLDLDRFTSNYTMDVICETAMGVNMNIQKENKNIAIHIEEALAILNHRIFRIWYHPHLIWRLSSLRVSIKKYEVMLSNLSGSVISNKMAEHEKNVKLKQHCLEAEIDEKPTSKRLAFLDLILQDSGFTETELLEEVNLFLMAGTETTATSTCCLFSMLGMHQEIQQKVYEEVIDILGPDRIVEASDLPNMKYTERVIKEGLRLFPIGALIARSIEGDIDLGDVILPAGSSAGFSAVFIHRHPKYWTDPLKFDPDRFLPEEVAKRHRCTYIPFSYGPRNCIGSRYAMANMKVVIATVIRQYRIFTKYKSVEEIQLKMNMLMRMTEGSKVWLEYR